MSTESTKPDRLNCIIANCNCDAAVKPIFRFLIKRGIIKPKMFRRVVLLDFPYCEPHSLIANAYNLLKPEQLDDLEQRMKEAGQIEKDDILMRTGIEVSWLPINQQVPVEKI